MKILEMYCGTKSISNAFRAAGHEVFTIDNDPKLEPDLCIDIMELTTDMLPWKPDVIWASPPCTRFSVASIGRNWYHDGTPKNQQAKEAIELVRATILLIENLHPKFWFIENPRGMLRKMPLMQGFNWARNTVSYCQYGDTRMKPTDIWTNLNDTGFSFKKMCKNGDKCHESAPRGSRTGTQGLKNAKERGVIPPQLCEEIVKAVSNY